MAQRILGVELGSHSVKAVVLESTFRGHQIVAVEQVPLPPEAEGADLLSRTVAAVAALGEKLGGFKSEGSAISLPGSSAALPQLTLPFLDARKIEATLAFEVEGLIPFDIEEVLHDHQSIRQIDGKTELAVGVARRTEVEALVKALQGVGLDPRVITVPALALVPLLERALSRPGLEPGATAAVVELGHTRCSIAVGELGPTGATLAWARTFSGGGADLTRALGKEFGVPEAEAEAWKHKEGDLGEGAHDPRAAAAMQRALAPLVRELRQSLRAAQGKLKRPVGALHLVGGASAMRGLPELLARELGVTAERMQSFPEGASALASPELQATHAHAYGLALRAIARGPKLVNLRKGELAFRGDLDWLRGKLGRLTAMAAVLALLFGAGAFARSFALRRTEEQLDAELCKTTKKILGTCEQDFGRAVSLLQGGDTKASQVPTASALEIFVESTQRMPADVPLKLQEVDITLQRVRFKGLVDSFEGVDQVVAGLKLSSCFGDVRRGRVQRTKEEKIEFVLEASWICGQNADKAG